jgi:hypothetical protein
VKATITLLVRAGIIAVIATAALAVTACMHADGQPGGEQSSYGTVTGSITRGPMSPVSRPGVPAPSAQPVIGAELKLIDPKGAVVATARTDARGLYRIAVQPGQYRVERGAGFTGPAKNLPALVSVSAGNETRFDVIVDTGIR